MICCLLFESKAWITYAMVTIREADAVSGIGPLNGRVHDALTQLDLQGTHRFRNKDVLDFNEGLGLEIPKPLHQDFV